MMQRVALVMIVCLGGTVSAVEWTKVEGSIRASPVVRNLEGTKLADGEFHQWVDASGLHIRIVSTFPDGRRIEETAQFRQEPELIQDAWSWRETRANALLREYRVDVLAGVATARKAEGQHTREWSDQFSLKPGQTFAGIGFSLALQGLRERLIDGERIELRAVGFTPGPRLVTVEVRHGGVDDMLMGDQRVRGDRFILQPRIPWIARWLVRVPDSLIWLTTPSPDVPASFLRWEGFLVEPGDEIVRVDRFPGLSSGPAVPVGDHTSPATR